MNDNQPIEIGTLTTATSVREVEQMPNSMTDSARGVEYASTTTEATNQNRIAIDIPTSRWTSIFDDPSWTITRCDDDGYYASYDGYGRVAHSVFDDVESLKKQIYLLKKQVFDLKRLVLKQAKHNERTKDEEEQ